MRLAHGTMAVRFTLGFIGIVFGVNCQVNDPERIKEVAFAFFVQGLGPGRPQRVQGGALAFCCFVAGMAGRVRP